jgi:hypothetical protein
LAFFILFFLYYFTKEKKGLKEKKEKKKGEKKIENLPLSLSLFFFLRGGIASHIRQRTAENIGVRNRD